MPVLRAQAGEGEEGVEEARAVLLHSENPAGQSPQAGAQVVSIRPWQLGVPLGCLTYTTGQDWGRCLHTASLRSREKLPGLGLSPRFSSLC